MDNLYYLGMGWSRDFSRFGPIGGGCAAYYYPPPTSIFCIHSHAPRSWSHYNMPPVNPRTLLKKWCFTWNNPDDLTLPGQMPDIKYLVCQYESGLLGTPHIQGFVWFTRGKRLSAVRRLIPCHWIGARGTVNQNYDYCTKEEGRIAGPWEVGIRPGGNGHVIHRKYELLQEDLDDGMKMNEVSVNHFEMYLKHAQSIQRYRLQKLPPRDFKSTVIFMFGPRNSGKTYYVKLFDKDYWRKPLGPWFDYYDGQKTALYDDFLSTSYGKIQGHLQAFDKYKYIGKVHFGYCQFRPEVIFVTSNLQPHELFPQLQVNAPELVKAFWNRVDMMMKFEERESFESPSSYRFLDEIHTGVSMWTAGFKRGH